MAGKKPFATGYGPRPETAIVTGLRPFHSNEDDYPGWRATFLRFLDYKGLTTALLPESDIRNEDKAEAAKQRAKAYAMLELGRRTQLPGRRV